MDGRRLIARNVRQLREAKGWSQEELADRARLHRTYVSGIERGVRNPTVTVLEKIANGLGTDLASLVTELGQPG